MGFVSIPNSFNFSAPFVYTKFSGSISRPSGFLNFDLLTHHTSSSATMAASSLARKHLSRILLSSSLRPVRQVTMRSYNTEAEYPFYNPFYVVCGPCPKSQTPPSWPHLHHEYLVRNLRDGFHICLYMAGVGKGNVKVWIEGCELIAEGIKEKDFEDEDNNTTNTLLRYRMLSPHHEYFNLDAIKAEINNGMLKVFVPRIDQNAFVPKEC